MYATGRFTDLRHRLTFFMNFYLSSDTFDKLLKSLSVEVNHYYENDPPLFLGVGISGAEIVGRLPYFSDYTNPEISVCDVQREKDKIEIIKFPEDVRDKRILICYIRVDTGKTLEKLYKHALNLGAKDVATLSLVVRKGATVFPNFYSFVIGDNDNTFFLLEDYPPDLPPPYPPVNRLPKGIFRLLREDDIDKEWLFCKEPRIDKFSPADFLHQGALDYRYRTYIIDNGEKIVGLLHVFDKSVDEVYIQYLAIDDSEKKKGYGSMLLDFMLEFCKFNNKKFISLNAFKEREDFYLNNGFEKMKEIHLPKYGTLVYMRKKCIQADW